MSSRAETRLKDSATVASYGLGWAPEATYCPLTLAQTISFATSFGFAWACGGADGAAGAGGAAASAEAATSAAVRELSASSTGPGAVEDGGSSTVSSAPVSKSIDVSDHQPGSSDRNS